MDANQQTVSLDSMVIVVQQAEDVGSSQVFTLVSQDLEGDLAPLTAEDKDSDVSDLLGTVVEGQARTEDGQILYLTYMVNQPQQQQRMILHMGEDGSTYMLPAEQASEGSTLLSILPREPESKKDLEKKRTRTEQVIESELNIEDKLVVLDAMLTPAPSRKRKLRKDAKKTEGEKEEEEEENYVCDLCGASFARPAQYYGHLHSHSGERKWECTLCPTPAEFSSQSQLRRHEKQCHLNLRPHVCPLCPARFDRASQLSYHMRRIHDNEKAHTCQICNKGFFKRSDLRTHLNIHLGINKSICEICGKKFNHVSNLIRHARMHSGIKPYPCVVCGRRFSQLNALHQHKVSHQTEKDVSCGLCSKMFKSHTILRKHVKHTHGDNMPSKSKEGGQVRHFYCKVCGESFEFAALLKEHENQHEKEKNFHCQACKQDFPNINVLKNHACQSPEDRLQREADCLSLNSQLESLLQNQTALMDGDGGLIIYVTQDGQTEAAQVHIKPLPSQPAKEVPDDVPSAVPTEQDPLSEDVLLFENSSLAAPSDSGAMFLATPVSQELHDTVQQFLPVEQQEEKDPLAPDQGPKKKKVAPVYQCSECNKVFTKNSNYKQHLGTHFMEEMNYCCPMCGQFFAWKSTLNKHILRLHTSEKPPPVQCEICHREYATGALVQDHIKRDHYKQRPHCCGVCKKTFFKKYDLTIHYRTHTKERPYICRTCGKRFYHLSHVIRHERIHSGSRPYKCPECGKQFNQSSSLKSHRKRHTRPSKEKSAEKDLGFAEEVVSAVEFPMDESNILLYTAPL